MSSPAPSARSHRILVVEDAALTPVTMADASLRPAGFEVITTTSGADTVRLAREHRPDLILLDLDLPSLDEWTVCQQLRLDPDLSAIPILVATEQSALIEHMSGLAVGADDHVRKPIAPGELLIRVGRLLNMHRVRSTGRRLPHLDDADAILSYDDFVRRAREVITAGPATLMLLRTPPALRDVVADQLAGELRRRDLLARYSPTHLILLAPDQSAAATARAATERVIEQLESPERRKIAVGAVETDGGAVAAETLDALVARADMALAEARVRQGDDTERPSVVVADGDPDAQEIVDTRLRAAGYRTWLAFDGAHALETVHRERPDILLLEISLAKLTGFDVLSRLRELGDDGPMSIVVSSRERDDDVTRAFDLGAHDYVPKPFNPDELVARIARLLR